MLQVSLPLMGIAGRYVLQNLELVDTSCLECAQQLSRDRRAYAEAERRVQVGANRRLVPQTAFPHCQHSQLEPFRSCRSEEHTSELQSRLHLVCRLLLEK